jgi:hypothetical protein
MLEYKQFSASLLCDGQELREFEVVVDPKKHEVRCYVVAEENKVCAQGCVSYMMLIANPSHSSCDSQTVERVLRP